MTEQLTTKQMIHKLRDYDYGSGYMGSNICSLQPEHSEQIAAKIEELEAQLSKPKVNWAKVEEKQWEEAYSRIAELEAQLEAADNLIDGLMANGVYYKFWYPMDAYMKLRGNLEEKREKWKHIIGG